MVAIVAVRAFGLAKGVFRYLERLASHDVALRVLADLGVRVWESLVRLGPAASGRLRRGDLLTRLITDVDDQQDVLVRSLVPGVCAALVGTATSLALGLVLPAAGLVLAVGLVGAGILAPAVTLWAVRASGSRTAATRGAVVALAGEFLVAGPDLVAFTAAERRRARIADLDRGLAALTRRAAAGTGLGGAVSVLAVGGSMVGCAVAGVVALRAGTLPGPALAVLVRPRWRSPNWSPACPTPRSGWSRGVTPRDGSPSWRAPRRPSPSRAPRDRRPGDGRSPRTGSRSAGRVRTGTRCTPWTCAWRPAVTWPSAAPPGRGRAP